MSFLFTSESVSEGHPDKICDQISDAILDAALSQDPMSRVAIECFATSGLIVVGGEMTTKANIPIQAIVRDQLRKIGYTNSDYGIHADYCAVLVAIHEQSADIAMGVNTNEGLHQKMGAGDQGLMFGYACKTGPEMMPLPIVLSHSLVRECSRLRHQQKLGYLRPDAKAQVTIEYNQKREPIRIDTIVLPTQHDPEITHPELEHDMIAMIKTICPEHLLDQDTRYLINPTGRFVIGGPHGDTGLTGRKIIVDTYGGWISHGGGCFSGKDGTKVDRSGAYMARYIAKNMVHQGFADELEIQLAYAIGYSEPVSIKINDFGTAKTSQHAILEHINSNYDLSPEGIINTLKLRKPIFLDTATYGHFGRLDLDLPWEKLV